MSKIKKFTLLGLSLMTTQAYALFDSCGDRLKAMEVDEREVETLCTKYEKSIDKMALAAGSSDEKKTINFLLNSTIEVLPEVKVGIGVLWGTGKIQTYKRLALSPDNALKVVRAIPEEALDTFPYLMAALYPERKGMDEGDLNTDEVFYDTMDIIKRIPAEKLKNAGLVAKSYHGKPKDLDKLVNSLPSEKLLSLGTLLEKMPLNKALEFNSKYTQLEIICGLSFPAADESNLSANVQTCNSFKNGELCKAKSMVFETLSKNHMKPGVEKYFKHLNESDLFTNNQAFLIQTLFSKDSYRTVMDEVFKNENISDELLAQIVNVLQTPNASPESILKLLQQNKTPSSKMSLPQDFRFSPKVPFKDREKGCYELEEAHAQLLSYKRTHEVECKKYFSDKQMLTCDVQAVVGYIDNSTECAYEVFLTPIFAAPGAKSCYTNDLQDSLAALKGVNGKSKRDEKVLINDSKKVKDSTPSDKVETKKAMAK
ncbi:hypothetical protein SHI21_11670 [Bacteriovorax sp. PP10]|uniref:Uncharacterized protein n=1 Tax=Bacteriovorax antarcticus TaxID=3088717 RepID=A0ABU5VV02_9BACT|nr:hypothetical protein [Bacteriovorax sp. PP10]MEA9356871.1 hypothetical protein [Bacteriovorax sp. PP10]